MTSCVQLGLILGSLVTTGAGVEKSYIWVVWKPKKTRLNNSFLYYVIKYSKLARFSYRCAQVHPAPSKSTGTLVRSHRNHAAVPILLTGQCFCACTPSLSLSKNASSAAHCIYNLKNDPACYWLELSFGVFSSDHMVKGIIRVYLSFVL